MTHVLKADKQTSGVKFGMTIDLEKEFMCCDLVEQYNCKCAHANNLPSMNSAIKNEFETRSQLEMKNLRSH